MSRAPIARFPYLLDGSIEPTVCVAPSSRATSSGPRPSGVIGALEANVFAQDVVEAVPVAEAATRVVELEADLP